MSKVFSHLRRKMSRHSIRYQTIAAFLLTVIGAVLISITVTVSTQQFLSQYHAVASQVTLANRIVPLVREHIGTEAYYLVAGRKTPMTTLLNDDIKQLHQMIDDLGHGNNTQDSRQQLRIAGRTLGTLEKYSTRLLTQLNRGDSLVKQNETLDQIRSVSSLMYDQFSEYIYMQLNELDRLDAQIQNQATLILAINVTALLLILLLLSINQYRLERSINEPIEALVENIQRLGEGDFAAHVKWTDKNEITVISDSFNGMVDRLHRLMEQVLEDTRMREQLELRLMQEQINPHFLYNTLEIIIWLAESGDQKKQVEIVKSLSRFFRTVLSGGRARITVREELECIQSYLYIQQTRYIDIMRYTIEAEADAMDCTIQKLSLQPLVENALYHGIERKRGGGTIRIYARRDGQNLILTVSDTGCGMSEDELLSLREAIDSNVPTGKGFGLSNLQKRIHLSYGLQYGIEIASRLGEGTEVTIKIPAIEEQS